MSPIKVHKGLESTTIQLPELRPWIGRDVEITVRDDSPAAKSSLDDFFAACGTVQIDQAAVDRLREISKI